MDAAPTGDWPLVEDALDDGISSRPRRGATGSAPSTCWIVVAVADAHRAVETGDEAWFAWGDITLPGGQSRQVVANDEGAEDDAPGGVARG